MNCSNTYNKQLTKDNKCLWVTLMHTYIQLNNYRALLINIQLGNTALWFHKTTIDLIMKLIQSKVLSQKLEWDNPGLPIKTVTLLVKCKWNPLFFNSIIRLLTREVVQVRDILASLQESNHNLDTKIMPNKTNTEV